MEIIANGTDVANICLGIVDCVQYYQPGCGSYCVCDCNGDH